MQSVAIAGSADEYFVNLDIKYSQMPTPSHYANTQIKNVTIGDIHANILTLFHTLIMLGVLEVRPEHAKEIFGMYDDIKNIIIRSSKPYYRPTLTVSEFKKFQDFLSFIQVIDRGMHIRLLGDILSDRTSNDILTLELLKKIFSSLPPEKFEIIYSNHDNNFFITNFSGKSGFSTSRTQSAMNARKFLKKNPEFRENFIQSVRTYINHLNMFDYDEKMRRIYSHAILSQDILDACFTQIHNNPIDIKSHSNADKIEIINKYVKKNLASIVNIENLSYVLNLSPSGKIFLNDGLSPEVKMFLNDFYEPSNPIAFIQKPFNFALWNTDIKSSFGDIQNNIHAHTLNIRFGGNDATLDNRVGQKVIFMNGQYVFQDAAYTIEIIPPE